MLSLTGRTARSRIRQNAGAGPRLLQPNRLAGSRNMFHNILVAIDGSPASEKAQTVAVGEGMNLVVVGQHGHSRIARFFLGSTTDRVSKHCPCTVMIVK
jgi:nucleotide-binding universal stress UspA family protein